MITASLSDVSLEYDMIGNGEPVLLIHPGHFAEWFRPLQSQPALASSYRLIVFHRAGSAGSTHLKGAVSICDHARHCRELLQHLGVSRAHVVGHSSSGNVALQLVLDAPEAVHSLALLEPALFSVPGAQAPQPFVQEARARYFAGYPRDAMDVFLKGVCGPGYRAILDAALPGAFEQHVADAQTFFEQEQPAMTSWRFSAAEAARVRQPVLAVIGALSAETLPVTVERHQQLLDWLPNVQEAELPGANHFMQVQNPQGMAEILASFFERHRCPITHSADYLRSALEWGMFYGAAGSW